MKNKILILFILISSVSFAQDIVMQNGTFNQCAGNFYDSGDATGVYGSNETFSLTICPDTAGNLVQVDFTAFSTQMNLDFMMIYDGDTNAAPLFGSYSGPLGAFTVNATVGNATGCLTFEWVSDGATVGAGWQADISCFMPCQVINAQLDSAMPAADPSDGIIKVCQNDQIVLNGSGIFSNDGTGAIYEWDLGDDATTIAGQTATFSYPNEGVYVVNLTITDTNPEGCTNNNLINQVIQVSSTPDFAGTQAVLDTICFGDSTTIDGLVTPLQVINNCAPPPSGVSFLEDQAGATYETPIEVDCYDSSLTLTAINQLVSICVTMEHSYMGDLDIEIISPTGQVVRMHDQGGGSANLGEPWATGVVDGNSANLTPGVGYQYCFVPDNTLPTLVGGVQTGGVFVNGDGPGTYTDTYVPAGNYSPVVPFTGLLGSDLNGTWTLRIVDNLNQDNGYVFDWSITFDPSLLPPDLSFTPTIVTETWDADPSITNTVGNTITVQPATEGQHCFTYRMVDNFGCEYTEQVCIDVNPEIITELPNNLFVCDNGAPPYIFDLSTNTPIVLASATNAADLVVTYHETLGDAMGDTAPIGALTNYIGTDGQLIYVRIEYLTSGCYEFESFTLNVQGQATINPVPDLIVCDDVSNDGVAMFDLESQTLGILGAQPASDFVVTYHLSFLDADTSTGALASPYTNVNNPEPIYIRLESVSDSNCFNVSAVPLFNLVVDSIGVANTVGKMELCDLNGDSLEVFDLTTQTATILGTQTLTDVTVSYHETQADADNNVLPILTPNTHTNVGNPQTIYVRVEDNINVSCYTTTTFDLVVNPVPPVIVPTPLQTCDDSIADGITEFDLTVKDAAINGGNASLLVTYFETLVDAQNNTAAIPDPTMYTNTSVGGLPANPQTLYVRVTDTATNCFITTTLVIEVLMNPIPEPDPDDMVLCDDVNTGDMQELFDLTLNEVQIFNGQVGYTASYHTSQTDAEQNMSAITTPAAYANTMSPETIFVRVEGTNGCYTVVNFDLIVNPLPETIGATNLIACELNTDGLFDFDLESKTNEILDGQSPAIFTVTYYESQADADNNIGALISPYTNVLGNPQPIYVSITNTITGCSISTIVFDIEVRNQPTATPPAAEFVLCDDFGANDGFAEFDLSTQDAEILNGQLPADYTVTYYSNQMDAIDNVNALSNIYENTGNPQVIYTRVTNNLGVCYELTQVTLRVQPIPEVTLEESYTICVDTSGNVINTADSPPVIETGLSDADFDFEWSFEGVILPNETASNLIANQPGNYSVIVTETISGLGCMGTASTTVIPSSTPIIDAIVISDAFADNHMIEAIATGTGVYEFSLDGGPWELGTDNGNGSYTYLFNDVNPPGEHTVIARDVNGCGTDQDTVFVFDYPQYFTPNGDGYNDTWNIIDFSTQPSAKIFIYDRYGKLLKQLSPTGIGWNGVFNGKPLPTSDYWFTVTYVEPRNGLSRQFKSHFTLKR